MANKQEHAQEPASSSPSPSLSPETIAALSGFVGGGGDGPFKPAAMLGGPIPQYLQQAVITNAGVKAIADALAGGGALEIDHARFSSRLLNNESLETLRNMADMPDVVYQAGANSISCQVRSNDLLVYNVSLNQDVGNFQIGSYGLYTNRGVLLAVVACGYVTQKTNTLSPSGANAITFVPVVTLINVGAAITVDITTSNLSSLPLVMTTSELPNGTISEFNAYIVESDPNFGGVANLYIYANGAWEGMTPSAIGQFNYENFIQAGINYNALLRYEATYQTYNATKPGAMSVLVRGLFDGNPELGYALTAPNFAAGTKLTAAKPVTLRERTLSLSKPLAEDLPEGAALVLQGSVTTRNTTPHALYNPLDGTNTITLRGNVEIALGTKEKEDGGGGQGKGKITDAALINGDAIPLDNAVLHTALIENDVTVLKLTTPTAQELPLLAEVVLEGTRRDGLRVLEGADPNLDPPVTNTITVSCGADLLAFKSNKSFRVALENPKPYPPGVSSDVSSFSVVDVRLAETGPGGGGANKAMATTYVLTLGEGGPTYAQAGAKGVAAAEVVERTFTRESAPQGSQQITINGVYQVSPDAGYVLRGPAFGPNTSVMKTYPAAQYATSVELAKPTGRTLGLEVVYVTQTQAVQEGEITVETRLPASKGSNVVVVTGGSVPHEEPFGVSVGISGPEGAISPGTTATAGQVQTVQLTRLSLSEPTIAAAQPGVIIDAQLMAQEATDFGLLTRLLNLKLNKADFDATIQNIEGDINGIRQNQKSCVLGDYGLNQSVGDRKVKAIKFQPNTGRDNKGEAWVCFIGPDGRETWFELAGWHDIDSLANRINDLNNRMNGWQTRIDNMWPGKMVYFNIHVNSNDWFSWPNGGFNGGYEGFAGGTRKDGKGACVSLENGNNGGAQVDVTTFYHNGTRETDAQFSGIAWGWG